MLSKCKIWHVVESGTEPFQNNSKLTLLHKTVTRSPSGIPCFTQKAARWRNASLTHFYKPVPLLPSTKGQDVSSFKVALYTGETLSPLSSLWKQALPRPALFRHSPPLLPGGWGVWSARHMPGACYLSSHLPLSKDWENTGVPPLASFTLL